jgi:hypothetical protein
MLDIISQFMIALCGCSAIWLVSRREHWKRWGYIIGLVGQPFWLYTSLYNDQWGIFALSLWYAYAWCQGIYNYWLIPARLITITREEVLCR